MKRITLLTMLLACIATMLQAQTAPTFSTAGHETWYYIRFKNGNAVLQDMGDWTALQTAAIDLTNNNQLWKFVGTTSNCEIISYNGRHIYYNGSRFATDEGSSKQGEIKLVTTSNSTYAPAWEIQASNTSDNSMNQWGGAGTGKELGAWTAGDNNNPLFFIEAPIFSNDEVEKWYVIQFLNGNGVLQDKGEGKNIVTATRNFLDATQQWKLVGNANNCEIVSRDLLRHFGITLCCFGKPDRQP